MAGEKGIGELLVREKLIDVNQLTAARKKQKESGGRLTSTLVDLGYVKDRDLANFLGQQYKLPTIDLANFECDAEAIKMVSAQVCQKHSVIPVSKADKTLVVAFSDPSNIHIKDDLALLTKCRIEVVVASESSIRSAIEKYYSAKGNRFNTLMSEIEEEDFKQIKVDDAEQIDSARAQSGDAPIVKFVNAMLEEAIKSRASDIHIEPYEKRLRIRFRIDGRLIEKIQPPKGASAAIVSRLKVISKMDIAERRRPQDGRLKVRLKNRSEIDFRVSSVPTLFGEKVVLRILDKSNLQIDMTKLGFEVGQLDELLEAIRLPQGMILITGPTGSGKTTTIYSCLAELNQPDKNLSTAEDPVEFNLDGINQVQINPDIDFNFSDALRSFLRQDPDIIMVGEIRDLETAKVAYKAASTGHLVVSTLHTNDAASTVARLVDMGV
ncbi:MAG: Flp pilus assembly complex ATPase component TadA, partial [Bdellovibrionales bacterium]|nr:Flp pilus assembly complex ATPase component TadA [Bdellovibrionales bacterium]